MRFLLKLLFPLFLTVLKVDLYGLLLMRKVLAWCEPKGISQNVLERVLIGAFFAFCSWHLYPDFRGTGFIAAVFASLWMATLQSFPVRIRFPATNSIIWTFLRSVFIPILIVEKLFDVKATGMDKLTNSAELLMQMTFYFLVSINLDGGKRKKRKLSWSKIKELFGTSWLPQQVPQENN